MIERQAFFTLSGLTVRLFNKPFFSKEDYDAP
ncbi:hypothetical protein PSYAR_01849 [Pseudomonas syringae pv. aceris str. M302273]|nr:hypothetical protein PSYAR_01849 [Pseudomonas syringae pv. aceris str. M302273]